ncbi:hypothetical protein C8F01DRAFT_1367513 [Mycena amicta]|nr:hypothetical protein C8F01DRAFT_1367513 [Mycena amicta]
MRYPTPSYHFPPPATPTTLDSDGLAGDRRSPHFELRLSEEEQPLFQLPPSWDAYLPEYNPWNKDSDDNSLSASDDVHPAVGALEMPYFNFASRAATPPESTLLNVAPVGISASKWRHDIDTAFHPSSHYHSTSLPDNFSYPSLLSKPHGHAGTPSPNGPVFELRTSAEENPHFHVYSYTAAQARPPPKSRYILPAPARSSEGARNSRSFSFGKIESSGSASGSRLGEQLHPKAEPYEDQIPPATRPKEIRRQSLACLFCRERKIACGRAPLESSNDGDTGGMCACVFLFIFVLSTLNENLRQCIKRGRKNCVFPTKSKRGLRYRDKGEQDGERERQEAWARALAADASGRMPVSIELS